MMSDDDEVACCMARPTRKIAFHSRVKKGWMERALCCACFIAAKANHNSNETKARSNNDDRHNITLQ